MLDGLYLFSLLFVLFLVASFERSLIMSPLLDLNLWVSDPMIPSSVAQWQDLSQWLGCYCHQNVESLQLSHGPQFPSGPHIIFLEGGAARDSWKPSLPFCKPSNGYSCSAMTKSLRIPRLPLCWNQNSLVFLLYFFLFLIFFVCFQFYFWNTFFT